MSTFVKKYQQALMPHEKPVEWSESFRFPRPDHYCFTATSYNSWVSSFMSAFGSIEPCESIEDAKDKKDHIKVGDHFLFKLRFPMWSYRSKANFWGMPVGMSWQRNRLEVYHSLSSRSWVAFDNDVDIPVLAKESGHNFRPWMSLTPMEVVSQRAQIRRTKGSVGLAGLGMGWCARRILERTKVDHVTIVEKDPGVLSYFGTALKDMFGNRVTLLEGDAYNHDWFSYDVTVWDIWPEVGQAGGDYKFLKLRDNLRKAGKVCEGWTCWAG